MTSHDVVPKASFEKTLDRVYTLLQGETVSPRVNPQEIALVYMIMAQGTLYNIEMAYNDPSAEEWLHLSQRALVKGDFLATNTVHGLQTLVSLSFPEKSPRSLIGQHLMAHHHLCVLCQCGELCFVANARSTESQIKVVWGIMLGLFGAW